MQPRAFTHFSKNANQYGKIGDFGFVESVSVEQREWDYVFNTIYHTFLTNENFLVLVKSVMKFTAVSNRASG